MIVTIYARCHEVLVWLGDYYTGQAVPVRFLSRNSAENRHLLQEYAADFEKDATTLDYCFHLACFLYMLKDARRDLDFSSYGLPPFWSPEASHVLSCYKFPRPTEEFKRIYAERMWLLCRHIGESPWTTRLWTLQEYGVSPQITFCIGTAAVPQECFSDTRATEVTDYGNEDDFKYWSSLFSLSCKGFMLGLHRHIMIRNAAAVFRPRVPGSILSPSISTIFRSISRRLARGMVRMAKQTTVFEVVATFRQAQSSEPRDKVFAIVSFMTFLGLKIPDNLKIDYRLSISKLYFHVSEDHILNCKGNKEAYEPLAPLRFARGRSKLKSKPKIPGDLEIDQSELLNFPSWAVDWTSYPGEANVSKMSPNLVTWLQMEVIAEVQGHESKEDPPSRLVSATRYNATKGVVGTKPSITGYVLTVSGIALGRVAEVVDLAEGMNSWKFVRGWPVHGVPSQNRTTSEIQDRRASVLRTLCADMLGPQDWAAEMEAFWCKLDVIFDVALEQFKEPASFSVLAKEVRKMVERRAERGGWEGDNAAIINAPEFIKQVVQMLTHMGIMSKGNSLFVTERGQLGLGGKDISVQENDQVFVLYQGRTPFVLRPNRMSGCTSRFQLVSECYVDGLMQGEAIKLGSELQRIEIE